MFWEDQDLLDTCISGDETELLQTDIQRFLAIIAFCLLAIFVLVQSIPVVSPKEDAVIEGLTQRVEEHPEPNSKKNAAKNEKTLYVAFESDRVFLELLEAGKIELFIHMVGANQSFRVTRGDGRIDFASGVSVEGDDLWEIKKSMVPEAILIEFRRWTTLSSKEMMFIVRLSPELSRQIREKQAQEGRLLIYRGGKVNYRPHGE